MSVRKTDWEVKDRPCGIAGCGDDGESLGVTPQGRTSPVLFISIDSLPPSYLTLNSRGERGGRDGDWLMPKVMRFLGEYTLFADARGYLPAASDMNHLNAVAGTSSAQTGVISVSVQPYNWNPDGTIRIEPIHVAWFPPLTLLTTTVGRDLTADLGDTIPSRSDHGSLLRFLGWSSGAPWL